jgi:predicted nucleic acid-binding protein
MPAISDSSPLILYGRLGRLDLLRNVFNEILIPRAVSDEVLASGGSLPGAGPVAGAHWINVLPVRHVAPPDDPLWGLGSGERDAILLVEDLSRKFAVLLDDRPARGVARRRGLLVYGSAGVLILAKESGLIDAVRPELDRLRSAGLYLDERTYGEALSIAGERR